MRMRPGLTATVDIDMGCRRIIEYFLEPLLRYKDKALRER
jgi:hemolysin D